MLLAAGAVAAAGADEIRRDELAAAQTWGGVDNVVGVRNLYFSAQPDLAALQAARQHGVGVVINLREPGETDWDEQQAATDLGLAYYNVPISRSGPGFVSADLDRISALVADNSDTRILLHCSSGNRAAAWFATHLARDHGMAAADAIELAEKAGMTSDGLKQRVTDYLAGTAGTEK